MTLLSIARARYPGLEWSLSSIDGREVLVATNYWRGKRAQIFADFDTAERVVEIAARHVGQGGGQQTLPSEVGT